ncbi:carbohydrate kinase family protein [candidate division WWE3 bacterium]|nr:carbohydrate kinase family protein [candidate division WWE3 bacterium]
MARIACIGLTTIDIIFLLSAGHIQQPSENGKELCLPFPTKISVDKRFISLGGNAPNVGAGLIATGHGVKLISQTGEDELGQMIYTQLVTKGYDLTYTARSGESNSSVILSYGHDRTILSYHSTPIYRFPETLDNIDWLYVSSLGYKDFHLIHRAMKKWLQYHPDVQVVYNPGRVEIDAGFSAIGELMHACHTVIVNKEEASILLRSDAEHTDDLFDVQWLLETFVRKGVKRITITDGKNGSYFCDGKNYYHMESFSSKVVDTTGAGDAFAGGYLSGIAHGRSELESLRLASVQSGHSVATPGATTDLLTLSALDAILEKHSQLVPRELGED